MKTQAGLLAVLLTVACTGESPDPDPPVDDLPVAEVQDPDRAGCSMTAVGAYFFDDSWVDYLERENAFDEWGNLAFEAVEDEQGGFRELQASFHGEWPLTRSYLDFFRSPVENQQDTWTYASGFLVDRLTTEGETRRRRLYDSDGDNPYDTYSIDEGDDGSEDTVGSVVWADGRIATQTEDDGADGSIERTWEYRYDTEGRLTRFTYDDDTGRSELLEQEWGGPNDNLLSLRREVGDGDGAPTVTFQQITWNADWNQSNTTIFVDGLETEYVTLTYDDANRLVQWNREFPENSFATTRELWNWSCP